MPDTRYHAWIQGYSLRHGGKLRGFCGSASEKMIEAFPELRLARGYVYGSEDRHLGQHWWCVAPAGDVVDPTAAQFATRSCHEAVTHWLELQELVPFTPRSGLWLSVAFDGGGSGLVGIEDAEMKA